MNTLAFAVDMDGVVADFTKAVIPIINRLGLGKGPLPMDYEPTDWDWSDVLSPKDWAKIWERIVVAPNFWLRSPAYREMVRPLARALRAERGLRCYFLTNRRDTNGESLLWQCNSWLEDVMGDSAAWSCIISPHRERKQAILEGLELRAILDDHPDTVRECAYTHAYLLDRPWNRAPEFQDLPRLYSMEEYLDVVRGLQKRLG